MIASPAKLSRPSRAYLHLVKEEHINLLAAKIRQTSFIDAQGTAKDPALLGPPSVEFAPYGRISGHRDRKDLRQGTIDQDQEFIDFLESLTNPITKPATVDQGNDAVSKIKEKITITPLIQFLKDKKVNKGKDTAAIPKGAKHARHDSKEGKITPAMDKRPSKPGNPTASPEKRSVQAVKVEKAARDAVRVINKQSTSPVQNTVSPATAATAASPTATKASPTPTTASAPLAEKKRERGNASAAARILQRDLGIGTSAGGRGGRRALPAKPTTSASIFSPPKQDSPQSPPPKNPGVTAANPSSQDKDTPTTPLTHLPNGSKSSSNAQPPKGPAASKALRVPASEIKTSPGPTNNVTKNAISSTATQAFLKHANPSQGITEPLLEEAFVKYGAVTKVEIDKKKGFAYIDFAEPNGLQEAIKASPVKVAQGQVLVLECKSGSTLQARNARGGSHMINNRGTPIGPRGGRGNSRRGGLGRGGATSSPNISNSSKPSTTSTSSSQANIAASTAAPTATNTPVTAEIASNLVSIPNPTANSNPVEEKQSNP